MTTVLKQYTLQDFNTIIWGGFSSDLKDSGVIELISSLADKVGAPSYIKTPVFPKREKLEINNKYESRDNNNKHNIATPPMSLGYVSSASNAAATNIRRARNNKPSQITDDDWNMIRTFQKTELRRVEGIELRIDTIRSLLNKLTETTFEMIKNEIFDEVKEIINDGTGTDKNEEEAAVDETALAVVDVDEENVIKIANSIFNTASSNIFYSGLYSKLFNELMNYHKVFKGVFEKSFSEFVGLFKKIDYVDPSVDYNKFCENTKTNDKRRAMSTFIVNLMKEGVLHPDKVVDIITKG